jgi:hypothetical protein
MDLSQIEWRKASYSSSNGGECVEVGVWRKASYSSNNGGNCVEVTAGPGDSAGTDMSCLVRDSKDPDGPRLAFSPAGWQAFTLRVKHGKLDLG